MEEKNRKHEKDKKNKKKIIRDDFDTYEAKTLEEAWEQKTVVVEFLKDLYGAHTSLIPEYYTFRDLLFQMQDLLETEQKVSADLREELQGLTTINGLSAGTINEIDLEEGLLDHHSGTPLLTDHTDVLSTSRSWRTRTVVAIAAGCTVIGSGIGALFTWLYLTPKI